jgi:hypothetical protein
MKLLLAKAPKLLWTAYFVVVLHVVAISGYYMPSGGWALGPRHLAPMLPFLAIPAAFGMFRYRSLGFTLGYCSLVLTDFATLVTALTPDEPLDSLLKYYGEHLDKGEVAHNFGFLLGMPSYLSITFILIVMLGVYGWAVLSNRQKTMSNDISAV